MVKTYLYIRVVEKYSKQFQMFMWNKLQWSLTMYMDTQTHQ